MKEQIITPEKDLSEMEIANLSAAEFKTLALRMLRELIEYSKCIREEMKATLREIKKNPLGTNREDKEDRAQSNNVEHMEEINSQPEENEETRIKKKRGENKKTLGHFQKCQHLNHRDARRTEEEQEIENSLEKIMKENFPVW